MCSDVKVEEDSTNGNVRPQMTFECHLASRDDTVASNLSDIHGFIEINPEAAGEIARLLLLFAS